MNIKVLLRKNGPLLFTIGACIGLIGAVVSSIQAGMKTQAILTNAETDISIATADVEQRKKERTDSNEAYNQRLDEELNKEKVNIYRNAAAVIIPYYILPIGLTAGSMFCLFNAHKMNAKAIAAIGAGYAALSKKSDIIEGKIRQFIGEYKQDEFDEEVAQDWIDQSPVTSNGAVIETGKGNELFFDSFSGRYFLSSKDFVAGAIKDAEEDVSRGYGRGASRLGLGGYGLVLNDWYHNYLEIPTVDLGGYFRFPKETFHVDLVRTPCREKAVAPYCWVLKYTDVDTI